MEVFYKMGEGQFDTENFMPARTRMALSALWQRIHDTLARGVPVVILDTGADTMLLDGSGRKKRGPAQWAFNHQQWQMWQLEE